jgi:hypothetical protein
LFQVRSDNVGFFKSVFEKLPSSTLVTVSQLWVEYREKKDPLLKELLEITKIIISIYFLFNWFSKEFLKSSQTNILAILQGAENYEDQTSSISTVMYVHYFEPTLYANIFLIYNDAPPPPPHESKSIPYGYI